ncbi:MAG: low molecular weight protein-tyrosine phosphatase [Actinomycetota bacterium]|nr:low molecular weight protein-tyrosine phosphatase [Actinomycetota bacterium]
MEKASPFVVTTVCLGNICRSPMAEAVLRAKFADAGLSGAVEVVSAGVSRWHVGEAADRRAAAALAARGYRSEHRAREFTAEWFDSSDLVLAMDSDNYRALAKLDPGDGAELAMIRSFDPALADLPPPDPRLDVPDPYYGGERGFAEVLDMLEAAAGGVVAAVRARLNP